jgi:hypothetical protein
LIRTLVPLAKRTAKRTVKPSTESSDKTSVVPAVSALMDYQLARFSRN